MAKEAELPSFPLGWQGSGLRLTVYGLVGDMVTATDAQYNPKVVKLESVEISHSDSVRVHVSDS